MARAELLHFSTTKDGIKPELFFRFYKEVVLEAAKTPPGTGFVSLKKLQDYGLVNSIITRRIAGL